jgi:hypothetical protein
MMNKDVSLLLSAAGGPFVGFDMTIALAPAELAGNLARSHVRAGQMHSVAISSGT